MELVTTREQIAQSVAVFNSYKNSVETEKKNFYSERLRKGVNFVYIPNGGQAIFCPSRIAGYVGNNMVKHLAFRGKHGGKATVYINRILGSSHKNPPAATAYLQLCSSLDLVPEGRAKTFWTLDIDVPQVRVAPSGNADFPDEVDEFFEGKTKRVLVNAYERNPEARKACLDHFGAICSVCDFEFEKRYGTLGRGFIHVHHLTPLSSKGGEYVINPIADLRPVCPNCHAMLHKSEPPLSVNELKDLLKPQAAGLRTG